MASTYSEDQGSGGGEEESVRWLVCPLCQGQLAEPRTLIEHLKRKHTSKYWTNRCRECGQSFYGPQAAQNKAAHPTVCSGKWDDKNKKNDQFMTADQEKRLVLLTKNRRNNANTRLLAEEKLPGIYDALDLPHPTNFWVYGQNRQQAQRPSQLHGFAPVSAHDEDNSVARTISRAALARTSSSGQPKREHSISSSSQKNSTYEPSWADWSTAASTAPPPALNNDRNAVSSGTIEETEVEADHDLTPPQGYDPHDNNHNGGNWGAQFNGPDASDASANMFQELESINHQPDNPSVDLDKQ